MRTPKLFGILNNRHQGIIISIVDKDNDDEEQKHWAGMSGAFSAKNSYL